eukprot:14861954-Alexandrium_andersonii.AAC.1
MLRVGCEGYLRPCSMLGLPRGWWLLLGSPSGGRPGVGPCGHGPSPQSKPNWCCGKSLGLMSMGRS